MHILIADSQTGRSQELARLLQSHDHQISSAADSSAVLSLLESAEPELLILSRDLPGTDSISLCQTLRCRSFTAPILLLGDALSPSEIAEGLDGGADDCLSRPWEEVELLARIRALCRRGGSTIWEPEFLTYGDLKLDLFSRRLFRGAEAVRLGFKEFDVLRLLIISPGILSKQELLEKVWNSTSESEGNNVEAYISFLRKKLFLLGSQVSIGTLRRAGYFLILGEKN